MGLVGFEDRAARASVASVSRLAAAAFVACGLAAAAPRASAQPTLGYEAESVTRTSSGASTTVYSDGAASAGSWVRLNANGIGDRVDFTLPDVPAGSYKVTLRFKANANRGIVNLIVDGTQLGGGLDQQSEAFFTETTFGRVTFPTAGDHVIRMAVIGRNSLATSYALSADSFLLEPSEPPPPTVVVEVEASNPVGGGATASTASDPNASGRVLQFLNADGAGDTLTFTTPVLAAGSYLVKFRYKTNRTRGKHTFTLAGMELGTFDQYSSSPGYVEVTLPYLLIDSPNAHTIELKVTGKSRASSGYILSADRILYIGQ